MIRRAISLLAVALCAGAGCSQDKSSGHSAQVVGGSAKGSALDPALEAKTTHHGGDGRAWLTALGDLGDNAYCAARLKLPLAAEPAWEYGYSAAEIGPQPSSDLVHFDGVIAGSGGGSVIFALDAATGQELTRKDAYYRKPGEEAQREMFGGLMFSPRGVLTGLDVNGRYYTWNWPRTGLVQQAVSAEAARPLGGFVALQDVIVGNNNAQLASMPQADPDAPLWVDQLGLSPRGIAALPDGTVVSWTLHGPLACINADGSSRWRSDEGTRVVSARLSPSGQRAYLALVDGRLVCRDMAAGAELWRFDMNTLIPGEEEARLLAGANDIYKLLRQDVKLTSLYLEPQLLAESPAGLALVLQNGDAVMLDPLTGAVRWRQRLGAMVDDGCSFDNGLLLHLYYMPGFGERAYQGLLPFMLDIPDWEEIEYKAATVQERLPRPGDDTPGPWRPNQLYYGRFAVLDPATGEVRHTFIEQSPAGGSIIPALDKVVVAVERESRVRRGAAREEQCRILAYNWLEEGAD